MNVGLAKIGQKMFFNRSVKDVDRSNTNGNVGEYLLFKLLIDNNPDVTFYMLSANDLPSVNKMFIQSNLVDAQEFDDKKANEVIDKMFILPGLDEYMNDQRMIDILNNSIRPIYLLCDDPRCLDSINKSERFNFYPEKIVGQSIGTYSWKGKVYDMSYVPVELASCYMHDHSINTSLKTNEVIAVANTSGKEYNRLQILQDLLCGINIPVYGRLTQDESESFKGNHKGELKFSEIEKVMDESWSMVVIPIKKGWVTSKYVECLMHNVWPIFYKDYAIELLGWDDACVINNHDELAETIKWLENPANRNKKIKYILEWYSRFVEPYVDGKFVSEAIMNL